MQSTGPGKAAAAPGPAAAPTPRAALPPASTADPPAATQAAEAPAPDGLQLEIPAANITVVRTAAELQRAALAGAQDIEIRAHLDLRTLERAVNPAVPTGAEVTNYVRRPALMYASPPLRSIRGNCSEPDAEAELGLPAGHLLPLKLRQCLLLMDQSWLMVNSGSIWVDNLYLKLSRTTVQPLLTFITAGAQSVGAPIDRSDIYVTATTFHGEHRGTAYAILCDINEVTIFADGCVFTDWAGFRSPIGVKFQSMATVRNSVFRNMYLHAEIVDVSFEGTVNFQNVSFVNVSLEHGSIVSTTLNDYQQAIAYYLTYYAEDDEAYDMPVSNVPIGHRSMFGEQLAVLNSTMSDCMYLLRASGLMDLPPGCPYRAAEARNRTRGRDSSSGNVGTPLLNYAYGDYTLPDYDHYHEIADPWLRGVTKDDQIWLEQTREVLPPLAPAPGWPPFRPPLPPPQVRTSLQPEPAAPSAATAAAIVGSLSEQTPTTSVSSGSSGHRVNVMAVLLIVAAEVLLAGALLWLWIALGPRLLRWCTWSRSLRAKDQQDRRRQLATTSIHKDPDYWKRATSHATHSHAGGGTPPRGPANDACLNTTSRGDSHGLGSVISDGSDFPPSSALNPDYEYALPHHLALFAQPPSSLGLTGGIEPGSTVVFAPYTVTATQPASICPSSCVSDEKISDGRSFMLAGVSLPESSVDGQESCIHDKHGDGGQQGVVQHSSAIHIGGGASLTSKESREHGSDSPPGVGVVEHGTEIQQGLQGEGLAQAEDMIQQARDVASGAPARRLQRQLDSFTAFDLFLGRFEMLGRHHRRRGGQAVVQFAQSRHDRCEFAVKFFLDWDTFLTEAALYAAAFPHLRSTVSPEVAALAVAPAGRGAAAAVSMSEAVARFLPQVEAVCDGAAGGLEDPWGRPLPPCIVMEKGESLQDLCDRAEPDVFTVFSVLSNVSRRLADMHAAGFVHRDLKPANVMWLPRQNRWTVIDFGCVARVGEQAPLSFSLAYAAPEVAVAYRRRQRSIEAQPALDAWSLGVTAYELLVGAPAFDLLGHGRSTVVAMLEGAAPLPWEGELSRGVQRKLGVLGRPVLQLLQREPSCRITLEAFHAACAHMYANSTSES